MVPDGCPYIDNKRSGRMKLREFVGDREKESSYLEHLRGADVEFEKGRQDDRKARRVLGMDDPTAHLVRQRSRSLEAATRFVEPEALTSTKVKEHSKARK